MPGFILVPDSFKGTLSSQTICRVMQEVLLKHFPDAWIRPLPVADGGEGSVDAFLSSVGGQKISLCVTGPTGQPVDAFYGVLPDGTAVIEMAAAAGLPLMGDQLDVLGATTYGVGELMRAALAGGARRMILCLGGSATNDGGCGAVAALGAVFKDAAGKTFVPTGGSLSKIASVDLSKLDPAVRDCEITVMCDIDNPLCGPSGAAAVFGPQKGASTADVELLDQGLRHLAELVDPQVIDLPGAGAAGGFGAGAVAFFGGVLRPGIDVVLDAVGFDEGLARADLVLTGEGRIDSQSLRGKVVSGVASRARRMGKPVIAVVGDIGGDMEPVYEQGVTAVVSINRRPMAFEESKHRSLENLRATMDDIARLLKIRITD